MAKRTIYELANLTLNESYLGMTGESVESRFEKISADPPPSLSHWEFDSHRIEARAIESFDAADADGIRFFSEFCASFHKSSTAVIRCELDCDPAPQHDEEGTLVPCAMNCDEVRKDRPRGP
ncbi:MAG: hypothetical protein CO113_00455 [Elusimicrobia bacterium CG_4_9_14_3_um_filter_62_55]|nr:MAG: hypothetical protein COR54_03780 [Elusimicrobia bacterium CG22_combo_CG10-13_8_21_14_all_63_91]PJA17907.1 MAG: hypothetical protein COX66_02945 [Elusimicrobia bacterium CG_4_10_14_0_2_um_filter_63_34]PJB27048.1 MAG: hypothetical protein CO113_00455 [Elusimicrobia bacterium CG_4_9_14_3_um_filter_62_55]